MAGRENGKGEHRDDRLLRWGRAILIGGLIGLAVCLMLLLGISAVVSAGKLGQDRAAAVSAAACFFGAFLGGSWTVRQCGSRALAVGSAAGAAHALFLLTVGTVLFRCGPSAAGAGLLTALCLCGGAGAGLVDRLVLPKKKRRK